MKPSAQHLSTILLWMALTVAGLAGTALMVMAQADDSALPLDVRVWNPPFNLLGKSNPIVYRPLQQASKPWRICVSLPHLKDPYWLAVNYAHITEARKLGLQLHIFEAGGYQNLPTQRLQLEDCVNNYRPDGIILSAISPDGLNDLLKRYHQQGIAIVDLINTIDSADIDARAAVDYWENGYQTAQYLHRYGKEAGRPLKIAWFPGPEVAGWAQRGDAGFRQGLAGTDVEIITVRWGDTGRAIQGQLVSEVLSDHPDIDLIVGTSVAAEAAVEILRRQQLCERVKVVSYYYGPNVHRAIKRGDVLAAASDRQGIQARLSLDLISRILERRSYYRHVGPAVIMVDKTTIEDFDASSSVPPRGFRPVFTVGR